MATKKAKKQAAARPRGKTKVLSKRKAAGSRAKPSTRTRASKPASRKTMPGAKTAPARESVAAKSDKGKAKAKPKITQVKAAASKAPGKVPAKKKEAPKPEPQDTPRPTRDSKRVSKAKVLPRNFLIELAQAIKESVRSAIGGARGKEIVGTAPSGDATFELDKIAEKTLLTFLKNARLPVAYYSEDAGYTTFTSAQPTNLLVVDPIDGTRAAKSGFEGCVVSVASTRVIERPTIADLDNACVLEILGNRMFYAEKGKGARVHVDGHARKIRLSENTELETVSWAMTVPARPAELIFPTAARLIDLTSLKGGFFACNSTSYSLTRLLTGQLDACVDFANRYFRDIPSVVEDRFINAGRGIVLGICPYDLAASFLIAREGGCIVTDAYGQELDDVLLLDSSVSNQRSLIGAANAKLHEKLMSFFDTRIRQFEALLKQRVDSAASA